VTVINDAKVSSTADSRPSEMLAGGRQFGLMESSFHKADNQTQGAPFQMPASQQTPDAVCRRSAGAHRRR